MTHIILNDDILTLDDSTEIVQARIEMREAGLGKLPTYDGSAGEPGTLTGKWIYAAGTPTPCPVCQRTAALDAALADGMCHECADDSCGPEPTEGADLPTEQRVAEMLATLFDPRSDDDMRAEIVEEIAEWTRYGRARVDSYERACVLTSDAGFVLQIAGAEFQVTVIGR